LISRYLLSFFFSLPGQRCSSSHFVRFFEMRVQFFLFLLSWISAPPFPKLSLISLPCPGLFRGAFCSMLHFPECPGRQWCCFPFPFDWWISTVRSREVFFFFAAFEFIFLLKTGRSFFGVGLVTFPDEFVSLFPWDFVDPFPRHMIFVCLVLLYPIWFLYFRIQAAR